METQTKIETNANIIRIFTPYNPKFVERIKMIPGRRWNAELKCWEVKLDYLTQIQELVDEFFPSEQQFSYFLLESEESTESPKVDGFEVLDFSKHYIRVTSKFQRLAGELSCGGSWKHPVWWGRIIVQYQGRAEPEVWSPQNCKVIRLTEAEAYDYAKQIAKEGENVLDSKGT